MFSFSDTLDSIEDKGLSELKAKDVYSSVLFALNVTIS